MLLFAQRRYPVDSVTGPVHAAFSSLAALSRRIRIRPGLVLLLLLPYSQSPTGSGAQRRGMPAFLSGVLSRRFSNLPGTCCLFFFSGTIPSNQNPPGHISLLILLSSLPSAQGRDGVECPLFAQGCYPVDSVTCPVHVAFSSLAALSHRFRTGPGLSACCSF